MGNRIIFGLVILYIILRFGFTQYLDSLGTYTSYYLEIALVLLTVFAYSSFFIKSLKIKKKSFWFIGTAFILGGFFSYLSGKLAISIPFDFREPTVIFFLLLVAPILEELIFRFFLWLPLEMFGKQVSLVLTTALFSYSHLHALWFVPTQVHNFILFQTGYTLVLGFICGYLVYRDNSLTAAMLAHFTFNLGFYLTAIV